MAVLTIFPVILQTVINLIMLSTGKQGTNGAQVTLSINETTQKVRQILSFRKKDKLPK